VSVNTSAAPKQYGHSINGFSGIISFSSAAIAGTAMQLKVISMARNKDAILVCFFIVLFSVLFSFKIKYLSNGPKPVNTVFGLLTVS
jgi:hypothetical protein